MTNDAFTNLRWVNFTASVSGSPSKCSNKNDMNLNNIIIDDKLLRKYVEVRIETTGSPNLDQISLVF